MAIRTYFDFFELSEGIPLDPRICDKSKKIFFDVTFSAYGEYITKRGALEG